MSLKKLFFTFAILLMGISSAWAHKPLLSVEDNEDGTIYVEAGFSDGSSGAGHKIILKEKSSNKVIKEYKLPGASSMDIPMPKVPYTVEFNAGPGHSANQDGPFSEGTPEQDKAEPEESKNNGNTITSKQTVSSPPVQPKASMAKKPVMVTAIPSAATCQSAGVQMANQMMIITNLVIAIFLLAIFGVITFWMGYCLGKEKKK
jgi:hypothetical protein